VELAFETIDLRDVCENEAQAKSLLGLEVAKALVHRLADLRAADAVSDLIAGNPRIVPAGGRELLVIDLLDGIRIHLVPNHPRGRAGAGLDKVRRLKVIRIGGDDSESACVSS
jgi:toxin HigB-1